MCVRAKTTDNETDRAHFREPNLDRDERQVVSKWRQLQLEVADGTDLYQPLHRIVDGRAGRRVEETLQQALRGCHNEPEQQHNNRLAPIVLANEQVSSDAFAMSEYKVSTVGSSQRA